MIQKLIFETSSTLLFVKFTNIGFLLDMFLFFGINAHV